MRKIIHTLVFTIIYTLIYTFGLASNSISSEIKTLDDFNKSAFFKKYQQTRPVDSWSLKNGGLNYSFAFSLGSEEPSSILAIEIVFKSKETPMVLSYGVTFYDDLATLSRPTKFTKSKRQILQDFIRSIDSSLPLKDIMVYIQEQSNFDYDRILDAPQKKFTKYFFRAGTVGPDLIIDIEKKK